LDMYKLAKEVEPFLFDARDKQKVIQFPEYFRQSFQNWFSLLHHYYKDFTIIECLSVVRSQVLCWFEVSFKNISISHIFKRIVSVLNK